MCDLCTAARAALRTPVTDSVPETTPAPEFVAGPLVAGRVFADVEEEEQEDSDEDN